eukprot:9735847-Alexandrium_andersonii.AAC.1
MALGWSELLGEVAAPPGAHEAPDLSSPRPCPWCCGTASWARRVSMLGCGAPFFQPGAGAQEGC